LRKDGAVPDLDSPPESAAQRHWFVASPRKLWWGVFGAIVVGLAIHVGLPALAGIAHSLHVLRDGNLLWIVAAGICSAASLGCYVAVFRYVVVHDLPDGRWGGAYTLAMASQGASTIVTAAGAGGVALFYWALPQLGLARERVTERIVAFLAFHYAVYLAAIVVFGFGLGIGLFPGSAPASLTLLPAAVALVLLAAAGLAARHSEQLEARLQHEGASEGDGRLKRLALRLADAPASIAAGLTYTGSMLRPPRRGAKIAAFAVAYWATNIGILECCFLAFGRPPEITGLILAFFIGSAANLLPLLPGGVGSVEAGLIGSLLAFGAPGAQVVVSVLAFRLIGYWIPTVPEAIAYVQLRRRIGDHEPEPAPE
jgi:uncharacterized protein (TIRG00374 family)